MNYKEAIEYLYSQLPMFQRQGPSAYKANLDNTIALMDLLEQPQRNFKSIHVAGTNGKGSVSHLLASVFQEAGYKTGLYTSPHLKDFRERILINGEKISKKTVAKFVREKLKDFSKIQPSFFEMTVGLAFKYFSVEKVDIAIIEVGLGGRLDSTNIIFPELSIITNIGYDHTQFLGDTIEKIAREKAGIIKENTPVIIGETQKMTEYLFRNIARERKASISFADQNYYVREISQPNSITILPAVDIFSSKTNKPYILNVFNPLRGDHQKKNLITAILAIDYLSQNGYKIPHNTLVQGIKNVIENTRISGRWQKLSSRPLTICDIGHNQDGITAVLRQLESYNYSKLHFVFGTVNDKSVEPILKLLPENATYYFCKPDIPRGMNVDELYDLAVSHGLKGKKNQSVKKALELAQHNAKEEDLVFIGGSTFVVAEIL